jgi:hypothetical protein
MDLLHNKFRSGELSPAMAGAVDSPAYNQGCAVLESFVLLPVTGVTKCPGLKYKESVKDHGDVTILVGCQFGKSDRYILEFGDLYMRVYTDGAQVDSGGLPYAKVTPYPSSVLYELVFAASQDAIYIYHGSYETRVLTRTADDDWTIEEADFRHGPLLAENTDINLTITPSDVTGDITLLASDDLFEEGHIGSVMKIGYSAVDATLSKIFYATLDPNQVSDIAVVAKGSQIVYSSSDIGSFTGSVYFERSLDAGTTWETVEKATVPANIGNTISSTDMDAIYRFRAENLADILAPCGYSCTAAITAPANGTVYGYVEITDVTDAKNADATVTATLGAAEATHKWSQSAWSGENGYPACGVMHEQRLFSAATDDQPMTLWFGRTFLTASDYLVMLAGTNDSDAGGRSIPHPGSIQWMISTWLLLIGTDTGIFKGYGSTTEQPITPSNCHIVGQCPTGACRLPPIPIAGQIVYGGINARRVYEIVYSDDTRMYDPEDLTEFAEHVTAGGIVQWAFQQQPYPILWAVTADGALIGCTRDKRTDLKGWFRRTTDGLVESVAVIPGDTQDEVWCVVKRTIGVSSYRFVEQMQPFEWGTEQRDCFFVDSGVTWDGGAAKTVTGITVDPVTNRVTVAAALHGFSNAYKVRLAGVVGMTEVNGCVYTVADAAAGTFVLRTSDGGSYVDGSAFSEYESGGTAERVANSIAVAHLEDETLAILRDGLATTGVVAGGVVAFGDTDDCYFNTIHAGLPIPAVLEPMWPEVMLPTGVSLGRKRKITYQGIQVYNSLGGTMGDAQKQTAIEYREPDQINPDPDNLHTGFYEGSASGEWLTKTRIRIENSDPYPMTVLAIRFAME